MKIKFNLLALSFVASICLVFSWSCTKESLIQGQQANAVPAVATTADTLYPDPALTYLPAFSDRHIAQNFLMDFEKLVLSNSSPYSYSFNADVLKEENKYGGRENRMLAYFLMNTTVLMRNAQKMKDQNILHIYYSPSFAFEVLNNQINRNNRLANSASFFEVNYLAPDSTSFVRFMQTRYKEMLVLTAFLRESYLLYDKMIETFWSKKKIPDYYMAQHRGREANRELLSINIQLCQEILRYIRAMLDLHHAPIGLSVMPDGVAENLQSFRKSYAKGYFFRVNMIPHFYVQEGVRMYMERLSACMRPYILKKCPMYAQLNINF